MLRPLLLGLPFALLGVLQIAPYLVSRAQTAAGVAATERAHQLDEQTLGQLPPGWQILSTDRVNREENHSEGHYSTTFDLKHDRMPSDVRLSFDYPFVTGWHHLTGCYTFAGWQCTREEIINVNEAADWPYVSVRLRSIDGDNATLFFSLFDAEGVGIAPPKGELALKLWERLGKTNVMAQLPSYFQVQVFSPGEHTPEQEAQLLELFLESRETIRAATAGIGKPAT